MAIINNTTKRGNWESGNILTASDLNTAVRDSSLVTTSLLNLLASYYTTKNETINAETSISTMDTVLTESMKNYINANIVKGDLIGSDLKISNNKITHNNTIAASSKGPTSSVSGWGASIRVPYIEYDSNGHIKKADYWTITCPSKPSIGQSSAGTRCYFGSISSGYINLSPSLSSSNAIYYFYFRNENNEYYNIPIAYDNLMGSTSSNPIIFVGAAGSATRYMTLYHNSASQLQIKDSKNFTLISITAYPYTVV